MPPATAFVPAYPPLDPAVAECLTPRQLAILRSFHQHLSEEGCPPTLRYLMEQFEINSPNGVFCHIQALVRKGYLVKRYDRANKKHLSWLMTGKCFEVPSNTI